MSPARIPVIGIVGGIGSGKSTIAQGLAREFHGERLDADGAGHLALTQPEIKDQLRNIFGSGIFLPDGNIARDRLARLVFGSTTEQQTARRQLEQIVHPFIRSHLRQQLESQRQRADCGVIILDAALLLEAGWAELCDAVIYLDVPREQRLARVQSRGWTEEQLTPRENSQLSIDEKRQRADFVANNAGDPAVTVANISRWLQETFSLTPHSAV